MLPMVAALALPSSAVPVVAWALLMLALPGPNRASKVFVLQRSGGGGDDDSKSRSPNTLGQSVIVDRRKQRSTRHHPVKQRSRVRAVRRPAAPRFTDNDHEFSSKDERKQFVEEGPRFQEQFDEAGPRFEEPLVEVGPRLNQRGPRFQEPGPRPRDPAPLPRGPAYRPRNPAHRLRDNRRQRPPSVANSFVESMSAPISRPRDIVRGQVPEQPSLRNFMSRFRGLVLSGLGSMVPTFSP